MYSAGSGDYAVGPIRQPSPYSPASLVALLSSLISRFKPASVLLGVPGPVEQIRKTGEVFMPPLGFSITLNELHTAVCSSAAMYVSNDMFMYSGMIENIGRSSMAANSRCGIISVGTSTGFAVCSSIDALPHPIWETQSYEIAHDRANVYADADDEFFVRDILCGSYLSKELPEKKAEGSLLSPPARSRQGFSNYLSGFIQTICGIYQLTDLLITGGGLVGIYGHNPTESPLLRSTLNRASMGLDISINAIDPHVNYLESTIRLLKEHRLSINGTSTCKVC